jgi:predicted lipoprotein with Yx(FWY)xxD motif
VADTKVGKIIVDADGRSLYLFEKDKDGKPACYGKCADAWSPYLTEGAPEAGTGATADLVGTAQRTDGKTQVAYAGHPLYYYEDDKKAGDVTGNDKNEFGADWYALKPDGSNA